MARTAVIIGAGPAGLTAAYELLQKTDIIPVILEKSGDIGGLSKTVNFKGNRIDIGGHRFFSKSDRIIEWWLNILPLESTGESKFEITYQNNTRTIQPDALRVAERDADHVMLVRSRKSRIYYLKKFFSYPVSLSLDTALKLGPVKIVSILSSYLRARLFPIKNEISLEDFFINRFGRNLYSTFFKDYTEKVWGKSCKEIPAEWGAQRIKGLSITRTITHAMKTVFGKGKTGSIKQKNTETSLIERFMYPKYGPGQLWEEVARLIKEKGGIIHFNTETVGISASAGQIVAADVIDENGEAKQYRGDYFFSTMPVRNLIAGFHPEPPQEIQRIAAGLEYRDFITVGILLKKLKGDSQLIADNWIYIQEKDVKVGRLQIFNNWSPFMVKDPGTVWLGLEYFCNEGDMLWQMPEGELKELAVTELCRMKMIEKSDFLDGTVLKVEKTYPAYFGTYNEFGRVRDYLDTFSNLFLIGRNGMHKYNNADHSMLTAITAVENIVSNKNSKENIWKVNTEQEYHE